MSYNNIYNFKNPIRHFINIDNLSFPTNMTTLDIDDTCWTMPFKFRIKKNSNSFRTLKLPNIIALICAYERFKGFNNFTNPQILDPEHKRLSANMDTGDFKVGEYDEQLGNDFNNLCIYDNLIKLDIKEFYGRLYTHYLDFNGLPDRYITNMNLGATNGLIMGNYLSLYFAEQHLKLISDNISSEISQQGLLCEFSYFSDDFYFFCNSHDNNKIIQIFDNVLEKFDLERNDNKVELWSYETFNSYNLIARYWKKVIAHCNMRYNSESNENKLVFINQLLYRSSQLCDEKQKKIFINNFFKTKYFRELNFEKFCLKDYDYHQLCYLFKTSPEALLYSIDKFSQIPEFHNNNIHKFFEIRYIESLKMPCNDEQLYYFYAINLLGFSDIISQCKDLVLNSNNQVLISYYIKDNLFTISDITSLKSCTSEDLWFQNYHLILYSPDLLSDLDTSIEKYLIPKACLPEADGKESTKLRRKQVYHNFYKDNLTSHNSIVQDINDVCYAIHEYLDLRFAEELALYSI